MNRFRKEYWKMSIPIALFFVGKYLDDLETARMSDYMNKSKMFGRELKPGEYSPWDYYVKK
uniref:Putative NADH dehydrogenase n=1 Tax=Dolomedes mizhoanus TaxID=1366394 RepID=S5MYJ2_9ARAC|nr:putative NADH dehydrogenase [Dolomedes mizhoanus]